MRSESIPFSDSDVLGLIFQACNCKIFCNALIAIALYHLNFHLLTYEEPFPFVGVLVAQYISFALSVGHRSAPRRLELYLVPASAR